MSEKTFKLTVKGNDGDEQIYLKQYVDIVYPCFEQFKQKIFVRFPHLSKQKVKLYWIDAENDVVTIFNEEDFRILMDQSHNNYCRLFVEVINEIKPVSSPNILKQGTYKATTVSSNGKMEQQKINQLPKHVNVVCDACDEEIYGYRYKCLECPNYDLCMNCDKLMLHREHSMMRFYLPIGYSNWTKDNIDRLSKIIRKNNSKSKCETALAPVIGEMPEECGRRRRHHHRHSKCNDSKLGFNIFKYMHDLANSQYEDSKEATPTNSGQTVTNNVESSTTATNATQLPTNNQKSYDVFEMLSEFTRPLGFELNILSSNIETPAPSTEAVHVPTSAEEKIVSSSNSLQNNKNPMDTSIPSTSNDNLPKPDMSKPSRIAVTASEPDQLHLISKDDINKEDIFESHSNNLASNVGVEQKEIVSLKDDNDDSDREWDVLCDMIAANEKRHSFSKASGAIPKIPSENITTKNSSTNTSFDDIPKTVMSEPMKLASTPPTTPRGIITAESDGNVVNYKKLGLDLEKHIREQLIETQYKNKEVPPALIPRTPVHEQAPTQQAPLSQVPRNSATIHQPNIIHRDPHINSAYNTMISMGFSNEGGWLIQLLESVNGNISRALDLLQPVQKQN